MEIVKPTWVKVEGVVKSPKDRKKPRNPLLSWAKKPKFKLPENFADANDIEIS
jgi:hypothetical protein